MRSEATNILKKSQEPLTIGLWLPKNLAGKTGLAPSAGNRTVELAVVLKTMSLISTFLPFIPAHRSPYACSCKDAHSSG